MDKYLTKEQMKAILTNAPVGVDKQELLRKFNDSGYRIQGYNDYTTEQPVQKKSVFEKVTDGAASVVGIKNIAEGFGQALAQKKNASQMDTAQNDAIKIQTDLMKQIKANKAIGKDTTRLEKALADAGGNIKNIADTTEQVLNPNDITPGKVVGDVIQIGSYAFPYGKVAGAAGKVVGKTAGKVASGAAGGYLADIGFSLQEGEEGADIFKPGVATVIGAAIPGGAAGIKALKGGKPSAKLVEDTIGNIIGGKKSADIPLAKTAFSAIDTTGVKTREELSERLAKGIEKNSQLVDQELLKDTNVYSLQDLAIKKADKAGNEIATDYVGESLKNLDELYGAIGDDVAKSNINLLIEKATTEGLTRKEVNDIARLYSEEFGSKAFSKKGDALTSINAQKFANVRTGVKEAARGGVGGKESQALDRVTTAMYNTKRLVDAGVEGVNNLKRRVQDRNIMQKLGRGAVNMIDAFTGGFVKSAVAAALPSNAGLKTLNWLDLENKLAKDLKILQKAEGITDDSKLIKFLNETAKKFQFPGDEAIDKIKGAKK